MQKKKEDKIYSVLESIDETLKQQSSAKRIFIQGLVRGLGTALGATVLLALVTSLTIQFIDTINTKTFSEYFLNAAVED